MTDSIIKKFISIAETYNKEEIKSKEYDGITETLRKQTSVCMIDNDTDIIVKIAEIPKDDNCNDSTITEAIYSDTMQEFITLRVIKNTTMAYEEIKFAKAGYLDVKTVLKISNTQEKIKETIDKATDIVNECMTSTKQQLTKTLYKAADITSKAADKLSKEIDNKTADNKEEDKEDK